MKILYYRIYNSQGNLVGFKRELTEYIELGGELWSTTEIPHDRDRTIKLSKPPLGMETFGRKPVEDEPEDELKEAIKLTRPKVVW